jgi:hypothetical protein
MVGGSRTGSHYTAVSIDLASTTLVVSIDGGAPQFTTVTLKR